MGTDQHDGDGPYLRRLARLAQDPHRETGRWHPRAMAEVIDAVGCVLRGASHPMVRRVAAGLAGQHDGHRPGGPFRGLVTPAGAPLDQAVLLDSLACHVDEFDSLHPASATVPAAVVVPTALVVAASLGASGPRLLDAVGYGYDVLTSVAQRFGAAGLYARSWWPTSTFGALGAAAAAGHLLALDDDALTHALGIAASAAGGLLSGDRFGEGHYLSAAQAAAYGAQAAWRAQAGMTASWTLLDAPASRAFGTPDDPAAAPRQGSVAECVVKWYPCARPLHGVIEGLVELRRAGFDLTALAEVEIAIHSHLLRFVTAESEVDGPTEAAASAVFAVCAAAVGRESDPGFFRAARATWPGRVPVVRLVASPDDAFTWDSRLSGRSATGQAFEVVGRPNTSEAPPRLREKFLTNATAGALSATEAAELLATLSNLTAVRDVATLLPPAS
ncbi:MmgE/PrpD family protein [Micromonospora endophytica]|uniref:MmgE/PrpD N-terminal domain-containing protein n=2 Tax=Micromonospora endophytica TaxID=515350 RepID=A0A2W2CI65_9ACTN|nr:MmgE/PrpD family protein [Micromonospora endophytica]PZF92644.1 hypothetical protein C1I93_19145 [Micromonospora endophytica]RIW49830.1 hypothetical protein D3H59_03460 [Micromonospora endophytica]